MKFVTSFALFVQPLAATMTAPTWESFFTVLTGWVFASRRTVTRMILAIGDAASKHYSSYHRVFSAARWSLDAVGLTVLGLIESWCGEKLPTPRAMLAGRCRRVSIEIYGRTEDARVADAEARVHAVPDRPLRVVAVEALKGGRGQEAFYSTCHDATAEEVIAWYAARWSIEVSFHDSKQSLGFEEPQGWRRNALERTAPVAMLLYSLIVLWFAREGHRRYRPLQCPWYTSKSAPSFADMLATLRRETIRQKTFSPAPRGPGSRKLRQILENAVILAA